MLKTTVRNNRQNAREIYSDIEKLKNALSSSAHDLRQHTRAWVGTSAHNIRGRVMKRSDDIQETFSSYVTKQPFKSMLIALGSGFLMGWILKRRR